MRRPSPATGIALVALFLSLSGTAYAATGGNFLLGKANKASAVTSLSNKKGTALSLSSSSSAPPLTVSNGVQVPNLNASELDGEPSSAFLPVGGTAVNSNELGGKTSSAFLPANGTAANSNELGGTPASGYMQGGGDTTGTRLALTGQTTATSRRAPGPTSSHSATLQAPARERRWRSSTTVARLPVRRHSGGTRMVSATSPPRVAELP